MFLKKRAQGGDLFYYADGPEVDLVQCGDTAAVFTNVSWSLEAAETRRREVAGLSAARQRFPKARLELIAHEPGQPSLPVPIKKLLAWQYLLG